MIKKHPFEVSAHFERSLVLTFALEKEELQSLIPDKLDLDTHKDKWAFMAIAIVQTRNLKPTSLPNFLGNDFKLIGVRIFVRYTSKAGKRLRGLFILKSETDSWKMKWLGALFTKYNYSRVPIKISNTEKGCQVNSKGISLKTNDSKSNIQLPETSPFTNWKEARRFAGPLPFTFSYNQKKDQMLIVEGVRTNWKPNLIEVEEYEINYPIFKQLKNPVLASCFEVKNIPYKWKKGRIEQW